MLKNRKRVAISLPHELDDWLNKQAEAEFTFKGRLIEKLISEYKQKTTES